MNLIEGARRVAVVANIMLSASLVTLLPSFKLSLFFFIGGWFLFGIAWTLDGFARKSST